LIKTSTFPRSIIILIIIFTCLLPGIYSATVASSFLLQPLTGFQRDYYRIIVAKDGSGNFNSIQGAINSIKNNDGKKHIVFIKNGVYNEKLFLDKSNLALIGENKENTKIIYSELRSNWKLTHPNDYGAAVINIKDSITDITLQNLTIYNNYGSKYNNSDHQFTVRGGAGVTRIIIDNSKIISDGGDALSLWNTPDGMYYHNNCYFEGYVDYVCPRGYCYIENSYFYGHNLTASIWHDGSGREDNKLVVRNSYFDGVPGFPLGRHHRDAQFYLIDCKFSRNMADKKIYFYPSKTPVTLKWGENRYYNYNCHGDSIDFKWHADNLFAAYGSPKPDQVTVTWTFNGKWNPQESLLELKKIDNK
jgi:pectinesterase